MTSTKLLFDFDYIPDSLTLEEYDYVLFEKIFFDKLKTAIDESLTVLTYRVDYSRFETLYGFDSKITGDLNTDDLFEFLYSIAEHYVRASNIIIRANKMETDGWFTFITSRKYKN